MAAGVLACVLGVLSSSCSTQSPATAQSKFVAAGNQICRTAGFRVPPFANQNHTNVQATRRAVQSLAGTLATERREYKEFVALGESAESTTPDLNARLHKVLTVWAANLAARSGYISQMQTLANAASVSPAMLSQIKDLDMEQGTWITKSSRSIDEPLHDMFSAC